MKCWSFRFLRVPSSLRSESGQGVVEYALVASLISIAAVVVLGVAGVLLPHLYHGAVTSF